MTPSSPCCAAAGSASCSSRSTSCRRSTSRGNILLPFELDGRTPDARGAAWIDQLIASLGLGDRLRHRPHELSGGQQQRVAIARALGTRPDLVFADEPTGNLDSRTGREVLALLGAASREYGQSIAMVTHDPIAASYADRILFLADGRVVEDRARSTRRGDQPRSCSEWRRRMKPRCALREHVSEHPRRDAQQRLRRRPAAGHRAPRDHARRDDVTGASDTVALRSSASSPWSSSPSRSTSAPSSRRTPSRRSSPAAPARSRCCVSSAPTAAASVARSPREGLIVGLIGALVGAVRRHARHGRGHRVVVAATERLPDSPYDYLDPVVLLPIVARRR